MQHLDCWCPPPSQSAGRPCVTESHGRGSECTGVHVQDTHFILPPRTSQLVCCIPTAASPSKQALWVARLAVWRYHSRCNQPRPAAPLVDSSGRYSSTGVFRRPGTPTEIPSSTDRHNLSLMECWSDWSTCRQRRREAARRRARRARTVCRRVARRACHAKQALGRQAASPSCRRSRRGRDGSVGDSREANTARPLSESWRPRRWSPRYALASSPR